MEEQKHLSHRHKQLTELPDQILIDILARLPTKSILACRCVCKTFLNSTRNNPEFASLHFSKSQPELLVQFADEYDKSGTVHLVEFESDATQGFGVPVRIRSIFNLPEHPNFWDGFVIGKSCRGLICLGQDEALCSSTLVVMNPLTCEYIMLPKPESDGERKCLHSFVFGYSPSSVEFKVLCFFTCYVTEREFYIPGTNSVVFEKEHSTYQVEIHVVGTDSWRLIKGVPFSHHNISYPCFLDKAIHWICYDMRVSDFVVYFDFETEQFGEIPSPTVLGSNRLNLTLGVLGDNLCLCDVHRTGGQFQIWVMKEYGVRKSWDIQFTINIGSLGVRLKGQYLPVKCLKNGEIILVSDENVLLCCDPLRGTIRLLQHYFSMNMPSRFILHTPSFVSIKETLNLIGRDVNVLNINPRIVRSCWANLFLAEYYWSSLNEKRRVPRNFLKDRQVTRS